MNSGDLATDRPRVLVLGAYGLIGAEISRRLRNDGCHVTGFGRNESVARTVLPELDWRIGDLRNFGSQADWLPILREADFVVNCAGALQDSYRDDLSQIHFEAVSALAQACSVTKSGFIQISAVGVDGTAENPFLKTKASGDRAVRDAGIDYWIFRPGLVLAPTAYGGSALLRMIAAVPLVQPLACAEAEIQTVSIYDVADAVSKAVAGEISAGGEWDLVENDVHSLRAIVAHHRRWLGFASTRQEIRIPDWVLAITSGIADCLGALGWRSPLRTTAVQVLKDGIVGDTAPWRSETGSSLRSLGESLSSMPATVEDRLFARSMLLLPILLGVLFIFWFVSGLVGLVRLDQAAGVLVNAGWSQSLSNISVVFWSVIDMGIAVALLFRKTAAAACWAMVLVSLIYLGSASAVVPELWTDPLGPMIKVLPGIVLAVIVRVLLENR